METSEIGGKGEGIDLRNLRNCLTRENYIYTYHRFAEGESESRRLEDGEWSVNTCI